VRALVTGSTGFVGGAVAAALRARGDEVVSVSRRAGPGAIGWDAIASEISSIDAVVNLAGETIAGRWNAKKKRSILDSRIDGTRTLVDAITRSETKPRVMVSASAVGIYGETFEEVDESSPAGHDYLATVCIAWEAEAARAPIRVVRPRFGLVLGPRGGVLKELMPLYRAGLGGPIGGGKQWWSWVHLDDVVAAILRAIDDEQWHGPVNLVADTTPQRDFAKALGEALHRPAVVPTPAFALRAALGDGADPILLGQRVIARRAASFGFTFSHPELQSALANAISRTSKAAEPRDGS
jgi:uncharacterized protein